MVLVVLGFYCYRYVWFFVFNSVMVIVDGLNFFVYLNLLGDGKVGRFVYELILFVCFVWCIFFVDYFFGNLLCFFIMKIIVYEGVYICVIFW